MPYSPWYLYKNQQKQGPFTWENLIEQADALIIGPADMVWTDGMGDWTRADQVEGLIPELSLSATEPALQASTSAVPPPPPISDPEIAGQEKNEAYSTTAGGKSSTELEPNIAGLLCYLLGWITGLVFFLVEKENKFVRFHAMQSIVAFGGLTFLQVLVGILSSIMWSILWRGLSSFAAAGIISTLLDIISTIIWLVTLSLAIFLMIKAYRHEAFKLPVAGKIAEKQLQGDFY